MPNSVLGPTLSDPSQFAVNPGDFSGALSQFGQVNSFPTLPILGELGSSGTPNVDSGSAALPFRQYPGSIIPDFIVNWFRNTLGPFSNIPQGVDPTGPNSSVVAITPEIVGTHPGTYSDELAPGNPYGMAISAAGEATGYGRIVTIIIGLIMIAGGLYLLGTSSVADSLKTIARSARA